MLDDLLFSVNVVVPLFLCCVVGYAARRWKLVDEGFLKGCTKLVFYIAIPANIFMSIMGNDLRDSFDISLLAYVIAAILVLGAILVLLVPHLVRDRATAATMTICIFRSNFAMLGIPLAISLMGSEKAAPTMVMIPFATFLYTILTVGILILLGPQVAEGQAGKLKTVFRQVIRNPLIIASLASIIIVWLHIPLPRVLVSTVDRFADMCTGLSLFMLGAQLDLRKSVGNLCHLAPIAVGRLVIVPLLVVGLAVLLGFRGGALGCIYIFFAAPTAVNCYILADTMGGDGRLAGDAVLLTSMISTLTLMIGIFLIRSLRLL